MLYHRETVFPAKPVRYFSHSGVGLLLVIIAFSIFIRHRVQHKVIVIVVTIKVRSDYNLKSITPQFLSKLFANFMSCVSINLTRQKWLVAVKRYDSSCLSPVLFCVLELCSGFKFVAVNSCNVHSLFSFHIITHILKYIINRMERGGKVQSFFGGFFGIAHIVYDFINSTFDIPNSCDSHYSPSGRKVSQSIFSVFL